MRNITSTSSAFFSSNTASAQLSITVLLGLANFFLISSSSFMMTWAMDSLRSRISS